MSRGGEWSLTSSGGGIFPRPGRQVALPGQEELGYRTSHSGKTTGTLQIKAIHTLRWG